MIVSATLAHAIELTLGQPVLVTLDFSEFWSLPENCKLPMPKFSCRQWTTTDVNSFGVKYHLREVHSPILRGKTRGTNGSEKICFSDRQPIYRR